MQLSRHDLTNPTKAAYNRMVAKVSDSPCHLFYSQHSINLAVGDELYEPTD